MRLDQYQWNFNPRGIHNITAYKPLTLSRYQSIKAGWLKLVTAKDEYLKDMPNIIGSGITPIVRLYKPKNSGQPVSSEQITMMTLYLGLGVRWFEFYNEPNTQFEWPDATQVTYTDIQGVIAPLMDNWLNWAEMLISYGGYPAFPALDETNGGPADTVSWIKAMMIYLATNYYDRFRTVANNGLWCATHPYIYNHFYQESVSADQARPPEQEDANAGGWHFEYPYDPITQSDDPGRSVLNPSPTAPNGDPLGLTGMGQAFMTLFSVLFGGGAIPVIGTEGGIYPIPAPTESKQADNRFPPVTRTSQAEGTLAAFNWISQQAPPWFFGLTMWKEDDYWGDPGSYNHDGIVPAIPRLSSTTPILKSVPPLEALSGPGPGPAPKGFSFGAAGVHSTPDLHYIVITDNFPVDWFFGAAHPYWDHFQPTLITALDLIDNSPASKSLGISAFCLKKDADSVRQSLRTRRPNAFVDLIAVDSQDELAQILNTRVSGDKRFG